MGTATATITITTKGVLGREVEEVRVNTTQGIPVADVVGEEVRTKTVLIRARLARVLSDLRLLMPGLEIKVLMNPLMEAVTLGRARVNKRMRFYV